MSFRARLVGAVLAVTLFALGGALAGVAWWFAHAREAHMDEELVALIRAEAEGVGRREGSTYVFSEAFSYAGIDIGPIYASLYASDNRLLAATPSYRHNPPKLEEVRKPFMAPFDFNHQGAPLRGILTRIPGREEILFVASSRGDLDDEIAYLRKAMLVALLVFLAWAGSIAAWIVHRLTRDHRRVAAVARQVAAGDMSARIGIVRGDREVAQLAHDVDEMIERLGILLTAQQRFVAHAAHELRSPVTALYGELQLALRKERTSAEYKESIAEALDSAQRLKALAEDLLSVARLGGTTAEDKEEVSVALVSGLAARDSAETALSRNVIVELPSGDERLLVRPRDFERLLRNLIENAVRHSPSGGHVRVTCEQGERHTIIVVSDDGPGVPVEEREKIFEPFYRSAASRAAAQWGSGLGLGIARELARAHGGDLTLDETTARGASFVVTLPKNLKDDG